ncbi:hypothetical protein B0T19DRAFT_443688 [Cercophora scortea]|uniref:Uncharacterized protein n=1 Tax=Cercophora scortea TaxID=314031 RepID=A0AAE0IGG2_9PEZI|nr:hypothetical protein B0T19DRAFT_443688 [Cercophora scortea]
MSQTQIARQFSTSSSPSPGALSPQAQPEIQQEPQPEPQPEPRKRGRPRKTPPSPSYPLPTSTALHSSLSTFLHHAERTSLSPTSTVYVGTHYEYTVSHSLASYQFDLKRIGGRSDQGIDLLGTWTLPSSTPSTPKRHKVFVQCKALASTPTSVLIRELEGAFAGAPAGWRGEGVIGLLATCGPATKGIREAMARSRWPMGFVCCSKEGEVRQMLWNRRAEEEGLAGLGVGTRYVGDGKRLVLTWNGKHIASDVGGQGKEEVVVTAT